MKKYKYLFGPVPSRRFDRSLGVDLVHMKTCTMSCIFCQIGRTEHPTTVRDEYVPTDEVTHELSQWFKEKIEADYITLSGSGEPTLHTRFGDVLQFVKDNSSYKTALLTNGSLLYLPEVRKQAKQADVVKVTLSAWDQESFGHIHQPGKGVEFNNLVEGERALRAEYDGEIWMEVFILAGMNSADEDVRKIAELATTISPDKIHVNTAVRPAAERYAKPVEKNRLDEIAHILGPKAEVIAEYDPTDTTPFQFNEKEILAMLERRPCTAQQIADVFALHINEVSKYTTMLLESGKIHSERRNDKVYFLGKMI